MGNIYFLKNLKIPSQLFSLALKLDTEILLDCHYFLSIHQYAKGSKGKGNVREVIQVYSRKEIINLEDVT